MEWELLNRTSLLNTSLPRLKLKMLLKIWN